MRKSTQGAILIGAAVLVVGGVSFWASQNERAARERQRTGDDGPRIDAPDPDEPVNVDGLVSEELTRFGSARAFGQYVTSLESVRRQQARRRHRDEEGAMGEPVEEAAEASAPAPPEPSAGESITNVQEAGVDEGGIVKTYGDFLVVLRRGRLFSIRLGDSGLTPISIADAPPPGSRGGYYDEMLIHGGTIVVVGYNYNETGTELGIFGIDEQGMISRRGTFYLRSSDYYSSRNYASRLLGDRLVFYMPYDFVAEEREGNRYELTTSMPAQRGRNDWNEIVTGARVYRPLQSAIYPVMHTIVQCDLAAPQLSCTAEGVIGPASRNFYVSSTAVYLWVSSEYGASAPDSVIYRLPLDGSAPGALRAWGAPTDQFSFKESADGHLNVLVQSEGRGEGMWNAEVANHDLALLRVPLTAFGDRLSAPQPSQYTALPRPRGTGYSLQNRFLAEHVLYGLGSDWGPPGRDGGSVVVHRYREGGEPVHVALPGGVDRIEALGEHAMVIGSGEGGLHFSTIELGSQPSVIGRYLQEGSSQGETRSHGFFYSASAGVLGLPVRGGESPGFAQLDESSAGVLFLRVQNGALARVGLLSSSGQDTEDACIASCADWYGNSRPIFYRGRVLALLGYELVEARLAASVVEVGRVNFFRDMPRH